MQTGQVPVLRGLPVIRTNSIPRSGALVWGSPCPPTLTRSARACAARKISGSTAMAKTEPVSEAVGNPLPAAAIGNGKTNLEPGDLLHALQAMRVGDFSVRLPGDQVGVEGKIADTFNDIVAANQRMAAAARACRASGRPRGQDAPAREVRRSPSGAWGEMEVSVNTLIDDLLWPTTRGDARDRRGGAGRPAADRAARRRRPPAQGRIPAIGHHRQHHDQAARRVHLRGDARGARGRHRGQARRPGAGAGSDRRVEGPDRERELDGVQPHRAGAQHRRRDDRGRERRPVEEDHRRRARRDPAAEGSHQHDGGPAALVRLRSDARGARSRHRRQARRPGDRARRRRHLEGPDRLRERHVRQPDRHRSATSRR